MIWTTGLSRKLLFVEWREQSKFPKVLASDARRLVYYPFHLIKNGRFLISVDTLRVGKDQFVFIVTLHAWRVFARSLLLLIFIIKCIIIEVRARLSELSKLRVSRVKCFGHEPKLRNIVINQQVFRIAWILVDLAKLPFATFFDCVRVRQYIVLHSFILLYLSLIHLYISNK